MSKRVFKAKEKVALTDKSGREMRCAVCNQTIYHTELDIEKPVEMFSHDNPGNPKYYHMKCGGFCSRRVQRVIDDCIKYGGLCVAVRNPNGKVCLHSDISRTSAVRMVRNHPDSDIYVQRGDTYPQRVWLTQEILENNRLWKISKGGEQCLTAERKL